MVTNAPVSEVRKMIRLLGIMILLPGCLGLLQQFFRRKQIRGSIGLHCGVTCRLL
jgi:hypothetical protein